MQKVNTGTTNQRPAKIQIEKGKIVQDNTGMKAEVIEYKGRKVTIKYLSDPVKGLIATRSVSAFRSRFTREVAA